MMKMIHKPLAPSYLGDNKLVLQCYVSYNKYGGYCVPKSSHYRPAPQKILSGDIWEPDTIEFMIKHAGHGDIVHAGTYFGDFIPALSQACVNGAKLWAFEPNPENYRCALITIAINNLENVNIKNAGLGEQHSSIPMRVSDESGRALGGASRLMANFDKSNQEQYVEVDILKLDDVLPSERQISIIQLDVEGFEQAALTGAMETIKRCKPILILENLPKRVWLAENILSLGYQIAGKLHDNTFLTMKGVI
jgi:FkbM family methyltransferase